MIETSAARTVLADDTPILLFAAVILLQILLAVAIASCQRTRLLASSCPPAQGNSTMTLQLELVPIVSLVAGIAILIVPRLLSYIVAIYLIVIGVVGLFNL